MPTLDWDSLWIVLHNLGSELCATSLWIVQVVAYGLLERFMCALIKMMVHSETFRALQKTLLSLHKES